MNQFKFLAGDILVTINEGKSLFDYIKRWALSSPYSHVFLYMGEMRIAVNGILLSHPMLFESSGRGVVLQSLSNRYSQKVVVLRLKSEHDRRRIPFILEEAIKLASDSKSFYDYLCIVRFAIPRLICQKLGIPMPLTWHRDEFQICSEAVFEVLYRAKLVDILPESVVPLPGDFVTSLLLDEVWRGKLSEELV